MDQLIEAGLMTEAGLKSIAIAKENGSWNNLDAVEELVIPDDLEKAFKKHKGSKDYFMSLSKSIKKNDAVLGNICQTSRNPQQSHQPGSRISRPAKKTAAILVIL